MQKLWRFLTSLTSDGDKIQFCTSRLVHALLTELLALNLLRAGEEAGADMWIITSTPERYTTEPVGHAKKCSLAVFRAPLQALGASGTVIER